MLKREWIPPEEWLKEAQRLPAGQSKRITHGAEDRANMVIRNEADRWSAWCYECNRGGRVQKQHVRVQSGPAEVPPGKTPGVLTRLPEVERRSPELWAEIVRHFQDKGVSGMCLPWPPLWSAQDQRIVFSTPTGIIGRALNPRVLQKWHTYGRAEYILGDDRPIENSVVVLTEDYYSAAKVSYYTGVALGVACLGTRVSPKLLAELLKAKLVLTAFDGDKFGERAAAASLRTLNLLGVPSGAVYVPPGKDPKDMLPETLSCNVDVAINRCFHYGK